MHKLFGEWYKIASVQVSGEQLPKRWAGVESFVEGINQESALDMVRIYHGRDTNNPAFVETYCTSFQAIDPLFPMRENALELQVLAGASIVQCIEKNTDLSISVAYATVCPNFQGLGPHVLNSEIVEIAQEYLTREGIKVRAIAKIPEIHADSLKPELKKTITEAVAANNYQTLSPHLLPLIEYIETSSKQLTQSTAKAIDILSDSLLIHKEQANILWWILGEHSNDLKIPFVKIAFPWACLVAAKELSDLTRLVPGPYSAEAFLSKMIHMGRKKAPQEVTLKQAIDNSSLQWRENWRKKMNNNGIDDLCPLYYAVGKSVETGNNSAWEAAYEIKSKIKTDKPMHPVKLAIQAYQESLFIESMKA